MGFAAANRFFLLAAAAVYAAGLIWRFRRDGLMLVRIGDRKLLDGLIDPARSRAHLRALCRLSALILLILAASRPQFGTKMTQITRRGNDVFIAVDVSASMLAEDVSPSRMAKAKRSLGFLIQQLRGDRVGIIQFAGDAFLSCPLTMDLDAARLFLESARVGAVPAAGTALGKAIGRSLEHFPERTGAQKFIVLLTDGEDTLGSDPIKAAREAKEKGVRIYTVGLGTTQGEVIRLRNESGEVVGFKKDEKGDTVLSRLDESTLHEAARLTGGRYFRCSPDDTEIAELAREISSHSGQRIDESIHRVREDRYQIPLLLAIVLLLAEILIPQREGHFRRIFREIRASRIFKGTFRARIFWPPALIFFCLAGTASADFRTEMARGNELCRDGKFDEARRAYFNAQAESPESPEPAYNAGNAHCYEGDYEEALKSYDRARNLAGAIKGRGAKAVKSAIDYNRGWTLFHEGKVEEAIEAFKEVLRRDPGDEDAKFNLEWIKAEKRRRKKPDQGKENKEQAKQRSELSKEDAERVLEMMRDQERKLREALRQNEQEKSPAKGGKDW